MSYKTLLVHLHDVRRAPRLLDAAISMAETMDAHIVALAVMPPFVVLPASRTGEASVTIDQHREAYAGEMQTLKMMLADAVRGRTVLYEWREADAGLGDAADLVIEQARSADLVIACQKDPQWTFSRLLEAPDRLAIESGRPVLLIPNEGSLRVPPNRVTIACNGTREAMRAAFDALPLIAGAQEVNLLRVLSETEEPKENDIPAAELAAALSRHGAKCVISSATSDYVGVGIELLRRAENFRSDLLVMGAYGHSRLREFFLGGASRDVLELMKCPVLMSH